jgi:hypothetical protein
MDTHCHFREAVLEGLGRVFFSLSFFFFSRVLCVYRLRAEMLFPLRLRGRFFLSVLPKQRVAGKLGGKRGFPESWRFGGRKTRLARFFRGFSTL